VLLLKDFERTSESVKINRPYDFSFELGKPTNLGLDISE
jgi:hypothetical protein